MGFEIDADELVEPLEAMSREQAREAAGRWFSEMSDAFIKGGDERDYDTFPIVQAARPPQWDESFQGYVFTFPHPATRYLNDGTAPHEIEGDPVLAFEWEEMKGEEFGDTGKTFEEVFAESWPTVFLPRVHVDGIEGIRAFERGQQAAERWLEGQA